MEKKKLFHGLIALVIFIGLAIGMNAVKGFAGVLMLLAMALHVWESVWKFGRNWPKNQ